MRALYGIAAAALAVVACTSATNAKGSAATATPASAGTRNAPAAAAFADWPTYHGDKYRHGYAPSMPAVHSMSVHAHLNLDGAVYASPIVVKGETIVVTENDTVYAFNSSYQQLWKRHLGSPSPQSQRPCGDIDPLGITGTPAYASSTGLVYVSAELSGSPPTHSLFALALTTGTVKFRRGLDLPGVDPAAMQERGALTIVNGRVYTPFGGLAGDCAAYKGRVVGYALSGVGASVSYTVPTQREAGIWTPPGPVADNSGHIYVAVGNGASGVGDPYDHSDSVLQLSSTLKLTDSFSPRTWASDNDADLDLGSQGPTIVGSYIFQAGKSGTAYIVRRSHLGGIGGAIDRQTVCKSFGGTSVVGDVVYVPCTDGVRAVRVDSAGKMHIVWHASSAVVGSPVVGGGRVWSLDTGGGVLYSLSPSTGAAVGHVSVGTTSRFATPALYGHDVLVPTLAGVTVVRTA